MGQNITLHFFNLKKLPRPNSNETECEFSASIDLQHLKTRYDMTKNVEFHKYKLITYPESSPQL